MAALTALVEGMAPRGARKALRTLGGLAGKARGETRAIVAGATRLVALAGAQEAYAAGSVGDARALLATATKATTRIAADELALGAAAIGILDGRVEQAITALERLTQVLPEAWIHLGLAHDRRGRGAEALEAWRRARKAGVRFAPLEEWIAAKERVFGEVAP
ncbi:MAG: hypothetical protein R2939_05345 [Kofleriaceae bacterium]